MSHSKRNWLRGIALAAVGLFTATGPASASLVINGGTDGTVSTGIGNDVVFGLIGSASQSGKYGATISQIGSSPLTYTFLGFEAAFTNQFLSPAAGSNLLVNQTNDPGEFFTTAGVGGALPVLLDFVFKIPGGATVTNAANAGKAANASTPNFFASVYSGTLGAGVVLWLDDNGGSNDGDYDDFVLLISDSRNEVPPPEVPIPPAFLLFGTGLGLMGWLKRSKRRVAAPVVG